MKLSSMIQNMKRFYKMIHKDHPSILFFIIIGGIAKGTIPFISLYFSSEIIDLLINKNIETAQTQILIMLASIFVLGCVDRACYQCINVIADSSFYSVWKQTTHKAYILEYEEFEKTETMDKIRRAQNGSNSSGGVGAQFFNTYSFISSIISVVFSIFFVIQLFAYSYTSKHFIVYTIVLIALFSLVLYIGNKFQQRIAEEKNETFRKNEHANSLSSYIINSALDVQNGKDIRLYKMRNLLGDWYQHFNKMAIEIFKGYAINSGKYYAILAILSQLFSACVFIYVGISVLEGYISIGKVLLFTGSITRMSNDIQDAMNLYNQIAFRFEYLIHFEEFINSKNMHYDGTLPIEKRDDYEYVFEFKNVSFKYPNTENHVLKNINLKFNVNKRYAIVGQNGAGKTTLIKLLCRLYEPSEGEILLNGINIEKYDYEEYTNVFSVVFQDFKLFSLPLDQNIAGSETVDEKRCLEVLEQVGLKERVMKWTNKQHTYLFKDLSDGINVSGGEAQKIAIARALYKDAPFVIMDEPTAALDPIAESEIYESFNEMIHDKTAIFISHRMSSCKFCDEIIVFKNGEITQQGTHDELVSQDGLYQELWNAQAQYYS